MYNWKLYIWILLLYTIDTCTSTETTTTKPFKPLGFLVKQKTIQLPSNVKKQTIKLTALIGFTANEVTDDLRLAHAEIQKLKTMAFIQENFEESTYVSRHVNFITREYDKIATELTLLLGYGNTKPSSLKEYSCELTLPGIKKDFILAYKTDIVTTMKGISLTAKREDLITGDDNSLYQLLIINLFRIRETMSDFREAILSYAHLLDGLTANQMTKELIWYLQTPTCVADFEFEHYKLKRCEKNSLGLECIVDLTVHKVSKNIDIYTPVSYNDYQLVTEENKYIAQHDGQWGALTCTQPLSENLEQNSYENCIFNPKHEKCLDVIESSHLEEIKKHCDFEYKKPYPVVRTDEGLLVQSKEIAVREQLGQDRTLLLDRNVPYLLKTDKAVIISNADKEEILEPIERITNRELIRSIFSQNEIRTLTALQTIVNLDVSHFYAEYKLILGLSLSATLIFIMIITVVCKWNIIQKRLALRHVETRRSQAKKKNYKTNRNFPTDSTMNAILPAV